MGTCKEAVRSLQDSMSVARRSGSRPMSTVATLARRNSRDTRTVTHVPPTVAGNKTQATTTAQPPTVQGRISPDISYLIIYLRSKCRIAMRRPRNTANHPQPSRSGSPCLAGYERRDVLGEEDGKLLRVRDCANCVHVEVPLAVGDLGELPEVVG